MTEVLIMDHIYPTKDYKVFKIKEEFEKLRTAVHSSGMPSSFDDIGKASGISEERLKKFSLDICKSYEDYGNVELGNAPPPFSSFPKEALELNCVKTLREGNFVFKEPKVKETSKNVDAQLKDQEVIEDDMEVFTESVVTVRFYEPFKYTPCMKNQPRFHQEYQVLGSNFLTDLRDRFYCQCNYGPFFDISDNPHAISPPDDRPDPGFFFIHDTFFNDTRNPGNFDYSDVILKWFRRLDYVRDFKTGVMEKTKFEDLDIRVGYPCVYQHHGACEHLFCITNVDLLDGSDSLRRSDYPKLSKAGRKRSTVCDICAQADERFLVTNCALHVKDPLRVCDNCFFSFHYESDGVTKTCSFSAYRLHSVRPEK